jgi:polysaccharide export outer membrane protein
MKTADNFYICGMINKNALKIKPFLLCVLLALLSSCGGGKKVVYLQDIDTALTKELLSYNTVIQNDDILTITVSSLDMASVAVYNQNTAMNNEGGVAINQQRENTGYIVDANGEIAFLSLGKLKVAGKTRMEVTALITNSIKQFVLNPYVDVRIANFKITVLGEVARPGTFPITDYRISIPQALGMAGDLTIFGDRENVLLLRDDNGIQRTIRIDLTTVDFINADTYYLKQNDVLIVSPNSTRTKAANINPNTSLYIGIGSLILTAMLVIIQATR